MSNKQIKIKVCGPHDDVPGKTLRLTVSSKAPVCNPSEWKDLWRLSPFSIVEGGVAVPGMPGIRSKTVENAWQFLKVWDGETGWCKDKALAAFKSDCAIRYPKGKGEKAIGHYWSESDSVLDYIEARKSIYIPCYLEMLEKPNRKEQIERLRQAAKDGTVSIWDPDSYRIQNFGMKSFSEAVSFINKPFAHAFIVALAIQGRLNEISLLSSQENKKTD